MSADDATTGASGDSESWTVEPGRLFVGPQDDPDRYELIGAGMSGGEGITWRARYSGHLSSPLPVAIKVLHRAASAGPDWPTDGEKARWRDQTALLRHSRVEHLVGLHEVFAAAPPHPQGMADLAAPQLAVIEMEWVEGETLGRTVRGRPVSSQTCAERIGFVRDLASAVAQLHSSTRSAGNPIVHRDITPGNCIVTRDRGIVLIDVSTMQLPTDTIDSQGRHTPSYSAPEVVAAPRAERTPEADRYAVGAVAYFCLTGEDPPSDEGDRRTELEEAVREAGLDPMLVVSVLAMMRSEPADRPRELLRWAAELEAASAAIRAPRRRTARRSALLVAAAAATVAVGIAGLSHVTQADAPSAHAAAAVRDTPSGTIASPATGSTVKDCSFFSGTVHIPADDTVVLSKVTLNSPDTFHYVEFVFGFDKPFTSDRWRGSQYFNEESINQTLRVSLVMVPRKAAIAAAASKDWKAPDRLVAHAPVLAHVDVTRGPGRDGVDTCAPPS